jgi:hypothetical protein
MLPMRTACLLLLALCLSLRAADDQFYRDFLSLADTNDPAPRLLKSPLVVDTNNTAPKIASTVVQLDRLRAEGRVADLRLGMTMSEVVGRWGKPRGFYSNCDGGPRFLFADASVVFRGNALRRIRLSEAVMFDRGLRGDSGLADWIRVLGEPSKRTDNQYGTYVIYQTPKAVIALAFEPDGTMKFPPTVELPAVDATRK